MADLTAQDMATKLLAEGFPRTSPHAAALSDPIADTPIVVTLDELRPYEHNPRVTRNPLYDEIKASIRERGLDAPPAITRRLGEPHYIIRNGGNTRLAILRELWSETRDERFFRIPCLFRPWSARGEIVALTGHLAENELHGGLSFIERSLGVEKARELYEQESGAQLTQSELSRRLTADGYPVTQPHISRMQDAVRYLLPAIPSVLFAGLGRPQIERLTGLRRAATRIWEARVAGKSVNVDLPTLFQEVLAQFNDVPDSFSVQRVQDELIGQMANLLEADYDTLTLEMNDTERRQNALGSEPTPAPSARPSPLPTPTTRSPQPPPSPAPERGGASGAAQQPTSPAESGSTGSTSDGVQFRGPTSQEDDTERLQGHIVSPAASTDRLQAIQRMVADHLGDALPDFAINAVRAIPVQAGGLYPISDVWYIEPGLDTPDRLRIHVAQLAREIAEEAGQADRIEGVDNGIGFICPMEPLLTTILPLPRFAHAVVILLHALSTEYQLGATTSTELEHLHLADVLAPLLQGHHPSSSAPAIRLSDNGLVKLFRLLRLARRVLELENGAASDDDHASAS